MRVACSVSDPVSGTWMPTVTLLSAAKTARVRSAKLPATAAAGNWAIRERRVVMLLASIVKPMQSRPMFVDFRLASFAPDQTAPQASALVGDRTNGESQPGLATFSPLLADRFGSTAAVWGRLSECRFLAPNGRTGARITKSAWQPASPPSALAGGLS